MFGVGGGVVVVPLLILWFGYGEREATGTSLAAIVVIAVLRRRRPGGSTGTSICSKASVVGVPAVARRGRRHRRSSNGFPSARSRCSSRRCCVVVAVELLIG